MARYVQPVPARMPLRCPGVRQRLTSQLAPQPFEELGHVRAQLLVVEAALAGVGEGGEAIEAVGRDVAAQLGPCPPGCLLLSPLDVRRPATDRRTPQRRLKAAAALARLRVERERPTSLLCAYHT